MADLRLSHTTRNLDATVSTAVAASTSMLVGDMAAGIVHVDGVTATHTLTLYGSGDGSTYVPLYGFDGQPATVSVPESGGACSMPDALFALRFVKLVADAPLGTAATVVISLKS